MAGAEPPGWAQAATIESRGRKDCKG